MCEIKHRIMRFLMDTEPTDAKTISQKLGLTHIQAKNALHKHRDILFVPAGTQRKSNGRTTTLWSSYEW
jgi:hypothetical protein